MKQQTLAMAQDQGFEQYRKPTRRDVFLETMNRIMPWEALCAVVEPFHPKPGNGRPPIGLERMLRIHFLQHTGSIWPIRRAKRRCTTAPACCVFAIFWNNINWARSRSPKSAGCCSTAA